MGNMWLGVAGQTKPWAHRSPAGDGIIFTTKRKEVAHNAILHSPRRRPGAAGILTVENPNKETPHMLTHILRRSAPLLAVAGLAAGLIYFWGSGGATPALSYGGYQTNLPNGDYVYASAAKL